MFSLKLKRFEVEVAVVVVCIHEVRGFPPTVIIFEWCFLLRLTVVQWNIIAFGM